MNPEENRNAEEKAPKRQRKGLIALLCLLCTIVFGLSLGATLFFVTEQQNGRGESTFTLADNGYSGNSFQKLLSLVQDNAILSETAAKTQNSVITIVVDVVQNGVAGQGIGSGVIYHQEDNYLYVITNAHVVADAQAIYLYTQNNEYYDLKLIGSDAASDIAVVAIDITTLPDELSSSLCAVEIGDSDAIRSGDIAIAVGSPYDTSYANSVTVGVISYPKRQMTDSETFTTATTYIQTDVAINPGNSGGALLNEQGQLIGINSSKIVLDSVESIGFAIPVNFAMEIANSLYVQGYIPNLILGGIEESTFLTDSLADLYQVPSGLVVYSVRPGSSGAAAGLRPSDIIIALDGVELTSLEQYNQLLRSYVEGDVITVTVIRSRNVEEPLTMQLQLESVASDQNNESTFWGSSN